MYSLDRSDANEKLFDDHLGLLVKLAKRKNPTHDGWFRFGEYACFICGYQMCPSYTDENRISIMEHYNNNREYFDAIVSHGAQHIKGFLAFL